MLAAQMQGRGLISFLTYRRAAGYVDRILRGEKPPTFRCRRAEQVWTGDQPRKRPASKFLTGCSPAPIAHHTG
jgi:hypothetical protein